MTTAAGSLGQRIKQMLRERGMTQAELARMVGTKQQTISYIVSDSNPGKTSRYATKIAEVLGVNPAWLASGSGDAHDPTVPIQIEGVFVQSVQVPVLLSAEVPAHLNGAGGTTKRGVLMTDCATPGKSFALEIEGESMSPKFRPGDRAVIDTTLAPEPGDYVAALLGDTLVFRRYRQRHPGFELVPENQDWETVHSDESVRIVGVMTEHRTYRKR